MVRSGTAGTAAVALGTAFAATALVMVLFELFVAAAVLAGVWLACTAIGTSLMLRADPQQLSERAHASSRWVEGWARRPRN